MIHEIEEHSIKELKLDLGDHVASRNMYFTIIPFHLVSKVIKKNDEYTPTVHFGVKS